jgi:hypothetical protein
MKKHSIELTSFLPKGQVECEYKDNMLYVRTNRAIPTQRFDAEHLAINSYVYLPDKYKLPLRIDITAKIDAPGFYLLLGKGHINFGTLWSDNRRVDDIVSPARKIVFYNNHVGMDEFANISVLYDLKEMQIIINGEERYYSKKETYMKSRLFEEMNKEGFELKVACDKLVNLYIKSVSITEYIDTCGICPSEVEPPKGFTRNEAVAAGEKPTFERCISLLPIGIQNQIVKIDDYLRTSRPLKFKRMIERNGNKITYVASDYGVSYAIYLSNDIFDHSLQWYIITSGKPETWHRKADMMEETLERLLNTSQDFAERMFFSLDDCVGCYKNCFGRTRYRLRNKLRNACHGKLKFRMNVAGFEDVRIFAEEINRIIRGDASKPL